MFAVGLGSLLVLAFLAAWPDMEASVFDAATSLSADEWLGGLRCPQVITADEKAEIRVRFDNPSERPTAFLVRTRVSQGFLTLVREDSRQVSLAPGEAAHVRWPIEADDAAYGRVVLARVLAMRGAGIPAREASCGVLVLGVGGARGDVLFGLAVGLAAVLVAVGAFLWRGPGRPISQSDRARAVKGGSLIVVAGASLATGIAGMWLPSHVLLLLFGLLVVAFVERGSGA